MDKQIIIETPARTVLIKGAPTVQPVQLAIPPVRAMSVAVQREGIPGAKGDKGDPGTAIISYEAQNKDSVIIQAGAPVTQHPSGSGVVLASAAQVSTFCVGFALAAISPGFAGSILTDGLLVLADWTPLIGTVSLQAKAKYYLDPVAGRITASAPSAQGQIVQFIGIAIDTSTLEIRISQTILL
jgi:hypothetical protein